MSDSESDDDEIPLSQQPQDKGKGKAKEQTAGQKRKSSAISKDTKEGPTTVSRYLSRSLLVCLNVADSGKGQ